MEIPRRVTSVADNAFCDNPNASELNSTIPSFIKNLTFPDGSNCCGISAIFLHDMID